MELIGLIGRSGGASYVEGLLSDLEHDGPPISGIVVIIAGPPTIRVPADLLDRLGALLDEDDEDYLELVASQRALDDA